MITTKNGNAIITISNDGSRLIEYEDSLKLEQPLNIDIRVSTSCSFAETLCKDFCYENAVKNGKDCDYEQLKKILSPLNSGIELTIGCNHFTNDLLDFLKWASTKGFLCNLTINQGHIKRDIFNLLYAIENELVFGVGISYRKDLNWNIPLEILNHDNCVFHVIMGIDTIDEVISLSDRGVKKILVLGEKNVGYNIGNVDLDSIIHKQWRWWVQKLFKLFTVVAFDNLSEQQLKLERFFTKEEWSIFHQGEYSFYIDAVNEFFSPSSRDIKKTNWNTNIKEYFKSLN